MGADMNRKGILIHEKDTVVTLSDPALPGDIIIYEKNGGKQCLTAVEEIPRYHKAACRDIGNGELIYKYGQVIGRATADISAGSLVHTKNLKSVCMTEPRVGNEE